MEFQQEEKFKKCSKIYQIIKLLELQQIIIFQMHGMEVYILNLESAFMRANTGKKGMMEYLWTE